MNYRAVLISMLCLGIFYPSALAQNVNSNADENMPPDNFTQILKSEWTFLRDETDSFLKNTESKGEFETTPEFEQRKAQLRSVFINKVRAHVNETKLQKRIFGVLFKATFSNYNADAEQYSIICPVTIEAPYNIPSIVCEIPENKYVLLYDSVNRGFRNSKISLRFDPDFKWHVSREIARMAKENEGNIYFRLHFVVNANQDTFSNQSILRIIPKDISLMDIRKNQVYWKELIQ